MWDCRVISCMRFCETSGRVTLLLRGPVAGGDDVYDVYDVHDADGVCEREYIREAV